MEQIECSECENKAIFVDKESLLIPFCSLECFNQSDDTSLSFIRGRTRRTVRRVARRTVRRNSAGGKAQESDYEDLNTKYPLPTFDESGIDASILSKYNTPEKTKAHKKEITALKNKIDQKLASLRNKYASIISKTGWTPTADFDRKKFYWVLETQKTE